MVGERKIDGETATLLQSQAFVWNRIFNFMNSMSLKCAVELGIPDVIHSNGGALSLSELVKALHLQPTKARFVHRLMRSLVHSGFFSQTSGENEQEVSYALTPACRLILQSESNNVISFLLYQLNPILISPWWSLSRWFKSDSSSTSFQLTHGRSIWEVLADKPEMGKAFNEAMESDSKMIARAVVEECRGLFEGLKSLVDVGGGSGAMMEVVAEAFPHVHCTVLDLPHVVANLKVRKNLDFVGGDMFEAIPSANAVLLKWIIHDWDDERSIEILKNCKKAIPSKEEGGRVIIIDIVMNEAKEADDFTDSQIYLDMLMMVNLSGTERSVKEWENLFSAVGFSGYNIVVKLGARSLIEVYP